MKFKIRRKRGSKFPRNLKLPPFKQTCAARSEEPSRLLLVSPTTLYTYHLMWLLATVGIWSPLVKRYYSLKGEGIRGLRPADAPSVSVANESVYPLHVSSSTPLPSPWCCSRQGRRDGRCGVGKVRKSKPGVKGVTEAWASFHAAAPIWLTGTDAK